MASLDWSQCPAVESIPGKVSGAWVFRDTRMPVSIVFENLEAGATIDEIMEWFHLTREQIVTVLEFAARSLDSPASASTTIDEGVRDAEAGRTVPIDEARRLLRTACLNRSFPVL
jgi:uncharacterized protein (DUF433 family)